MGINRELNQKSHGIECFLMSLKKIFFILVLSIAPKLCGYFFFVINPQIRLKKIKENFC